MPFGKHKGWELSQLPDDYLVWLASDDVWPTLYEPLRTAARLEATRRFNPVVEVIDCFGDLDDDDRTLFSEVLRAGYRALAIKYHPDQGGSEEVMKRLTCLMERVRGVLV